jgi:hypothetical protein
MNINDQDVVMLYELDGVYDGWSIAELADGTFVNRWTEDGPTTRFHKTQVIVDEWNRRAVDKDF